MDLIIFLENIFLTPEEVDYPITNLFILINIENIQLLK